MSSQAINSPQPRTSVPANPLGYEFALLGLRAHESRVSVIRRAAAATATRIQEAEVNESDQATMLSHVAVSTYRLLDPRRREKPLERVRLCVLSEDDFELQQYSRVPWLAPDSAKRIAHNNKPRLDSYHVSSAAI